jgi:hypothetical protein
MTLSKLFDSIKKYLNNNPGLLGAIAIILMILQMFGFQFNIFSWPALFMALPLESKVWYLWIFNLLVTVIIGFLLLNRINQKPHKKIITLFNSEIQKIEKFLNSIPFFETDSDMIRYRGEEFKKGNIQFFPNTPVYSQYSKEMMEFNEELKEKLDNFYDTIQKIQRNGSFNFVPGSNYNIFQIRAFFENIKKARVQISEIKNLLKKELD